MWLDSLVRLVSCWPMLFDTGMGLYRVWLLFKPSVGLSLPSMFCGWFVFGWPHLACGLCDSGGCSKCGDYKICCDNKRGGSLCPNNFTGGNTTGVYGSIAMHFAPMLWSVPRVLPEGLNPYTDIKIKLQLAPFTKKEYIVLKMALLLWYNQVIFSKISCFLQWFFIFRFIKIKFYLFQDPLPGLETEFVTYFIVFTDYNFFTIVF